MINISEKDLRRKQEGIQLKLLFIMKVGIQNMVNESEKNKKET
jgi:hypothetical protein